MKRAELLVLVITVQCHRVVCKLIFKLHLVLECNLLALNECFNRILIGKHIENYSMEFRVLNVDSR